MPENSAAPLGAVAEEVKRPRRRARQEESDVSAAETGGQSDVSSVLLRRLVRDPEFLKTPLSEKEIARALKVKPSALREALIGFLRDGWLDRLGRGVHRAALDAPQLVERFATRLAIEREAMRRLVTADQQARWNAAGRLSPIVDAQEKLAKSGAHDDAVEWYFRSVEFHVRIVNAAGLIELAQILRATLWRMRIGLRTPLESAGIRETATKDHRRIIEHIREPDHWSEAEYVEKHLRGPMAEALRTMRVLSDDPRAEKVYWDMAVNLFTGKTTPPPGKHGPADR